MHIPWWRSYKHLCRSVWLPDGGIVKSPYDIVSHITRWHGSDRDIEFDDFMNWALDVLTVYTPSRWMGTVMRFKDIWFSNRFRRNKEQERWDFIPWAERKP